MHFYESIGDWCVGGGKLVIVVSEANGMFLKKPISFPMFDIFGFSAYQIFIGNVDFEAKINQINSLTEKFVEFDLDGRTLACRFRSTIVVTLSSGKNNGKFGCFRPISFP